MLKHALPLILTLFAAATASARQEIIIDFDAVVGDTPLACGEKYEGVGSNKTTIEFQDARLYVSNFRLVTAAGEEVLIALEQDDLWQYENVALLDFEDKTGGCRDIGTAETNTRVVGEVAAGDYSGLVFDLGVPYELNHIDASTAPSPLNVTSLFWSWQYGYKFARIEILNDQAVGMGDASPSTSGAMDMSEQATSPPANFWPIHLGATDCASPAPVVGPAQPCGKPNLSTIRLAAFDPGSDRVTLDVAGLLEGIDVSRSREVAPPGCMSGFDDPDCPSLFVNFGLSFETGLPVAGQRLFSVRGGNAQAGH